MNFDYHQLVTDFRKKLKKGVDVSVMGDRHFAAQPKSWLSTGVTLLDAIIGNGIPYGRIVEVFGAEAAGKSLLISTILGNAQRAGAATALCDTEQSYTVEFMEKNGRVDAEKVFHMDPDTLEDCYSGVDTYIDQVRELDPTCPIVIAIDSIAGLPSKAEEEAAFDENARMSASAAVNKRSLRKLRKKVAVKGAIVLMTNHEIANIGAGPYAEKTTTPGGTGPRFFSSIRIKLQIAGKILEDERRVGDMCRAILRKNRFEGHGLEVKFPMYFDRGIDDVESVVEYLYHEKQLGSTPGWVSFPKGTKGIRRDAFVGKVREDAALWTTLQQLGTQYIQNALPLTAAETEVD